VFKIVGACEGQIGHTSVAAGWEDRGAAL